MRSSATPSGVLEFLLLCVQSVSLCASLQEKNKKKADRMMAEYDDDDDDYRYYK